MSTTSTPSPTPHASYPASCSCPITQDPMIDPVMAADGHSYEREAIEQWIRASLERGVKVISPLTGMPLRSAAVTDNYTLKSILHELYKLPHFLPDHDKQNLRRSSSASSSASTPIRKSSSSSATPLSTSYINQLFYSHGKLEDIQKKNDHLNLQLKELQEKYNAAIRKLNAFQSVYIQFQEKMNATLQDSQIERSDNEPHRNSNGNGSGISSSSGGGAAVGLSSSSNGHGKLESELIELGDMKRQTSNRSTIQRQHHDSLEYDEEDQKALRIPVSEGAEQVCHVYPSSSALPIRSRTQVHRSYTAQTLSSLQPPMSNTILAAAALASSSSSSASGSPSSWHFTPPSPQLSSSLIHSSPSASPTLPPFPSSNSGSVSSSSSIPSSLLTALCNPNSWKLVYSYPLNQTYSSLAIAPGSSRLSFSSSSSSSSSSLSSSSASSSSSSGAVSPPALLLSNSDLNHIDVLSVDGTFIKRIGNPRQDREVYKKPRGLRFLNNDLYVCDPQLGRIFIYSVKGVLTRHWGSPRYGTDVVGAPIDICSVGKELFILDEQNSFVRVFDEKGQLLRRFGSKGEEEQQFHEPCSLASSGSNNCLYVSDSGNNRIQVFHSSGLFIGAIGALGSNSGQLKNPAGLTMIEDALIVCDKGNNRLQVFYRDGQFLQQIGFEEFDVLRSRKGGNDLGYAATEWMNPELVAFDKKSNLLAVITRFNVQQHLHLFKIQVANE